MISENSAEIVTKYQPSTAEKVKSAFLIGSLAAGSGASIYVASESLSNKTTAISLGLVALAAVPDIYLKWRDMIS